MNVLETSASRSTPTTQPSSRHVPVEGLNGCVYFVRVPGFIKIGWTTDITARIAGMQTGSPHLIELLATRPGSIQDERDMHSRFAHLHFRGEWFHEHPLILTYIEKKVKTVKRRKRRLTPKRKLP